MRHRTVVDAEAVQARVIGMYERHPFPGFADKRGKVESEMALRLRLLNIAPADYVGRRLLEAGCGTGEYACWYAQHGADVTAVDLSTPSLRAAAAYAEREGVTSIAFERQSVLDLPYADGSFDYVSCMGVLHHTPDPYRGFRELCRVLRPGGVLVVSLYNAFSRLPHVARQRVVQALAGPDLDRRVALAQRLFPRTCRALAANRGDGSDALLYDAFAMPHESRHSVGQVLGWFDRNGIVYLGAFGPITLRDNLRALALLRRDDYAAFGRFLRGYTLARWTAAALSAVADRMVPSSALEALPGPAVPSRLARGLVQTGWLLLGFRFSIFSLSGRKAAGA
ncbi:MAG TPA: class I SAM-dependent methyltransferase [Candidatus Tectomicrobia bacterium]|nr:class I SAM-dependent methyltransferase [Candidatus Tectomicrobia bacterium]